MAIAGIVAWIVSIAWIAAIDREDRRRAKRLERVPTLTALPSNVAIPAALRKQRRIS